MPAPSSELTKSLCQHSDYLQRQSRVLQMKGMHLSERIQALLERSDATIERLERLSHKPSPATSLANQASQSPVVPANPQPSPHNSREPTVKDSPNLRLLISNKHIGLVAHIPDTTDQPLCNAKINPSHWHIAHTTENVPLICRTCKRTQAKMLQTS